MRKWNTILDGFASAMETRQTWRTIREIGLCHTHKNESCQMHLNDLNKSFVNTPTVQADPSFYSFHRDHANSDIGSYINLPVSLNASCRLFLW